MGVPPMHWTAEMDAALISERQTGLSWEEVGEKVGVHRDTAMNRARTLGIPTKHISRGNITGVRMRAKWPTEGI